MKRLKLPKPDLPVTKQRGFTLLEIVIFIIVIGLAAGVLVPLTQVVSGSVAPIFTQQAITLVQGELDQVVAQRRAAGFAAVALGAVACATNPMPAGFTCTRDVCSVPAGNLNDLTNCAAVSDFKRVTITVNHQSIGNVAAVTLLVNY